jgi:hypothetical protein
MPGCPGHSRTRPCSGKSSGSERFSNREEVKGGRRLTFTHLGFIKKPTFIH